MGRQNRAARQKLRYLNTRLLFQLTARHQSVATPGRIVGRRPMRPMIGCAEGLMAQRSGGGIIGARSRKAISRWKASSPP